MYQSEREPTRNTSRILIFGQTVKAKKTFLFARQAGYHMSVFDVIFSMNIILETFT